jgi:ribonuclease PH
MKRSENRKANGMRKIKIQKNFTKYAEGSVLITCGQTKVICNASLEEQVPRFLKNTGQGWVTAEYGMLPRSTHERMSREAKKGKQSGRTQEISRLIGRALRASINLEELGERQITIDCDVIQADGGTRCASITGGYVALALTLKKLIKSKVISNKVFLDSVMAVSCGIVDGKPVLDLDYNEDSSAEVDMNFIMTSKMNFVEIQGTAEHKPFSFSQLEKMKTLAFAGAKELAKAQNLVLK